MPDLAPLLSDLGFYATMALSILALGLSAGVGASIAIRKGRDSEAELRAAALISAILGPVGWLAIWLGPMGRWGGDE